MSLLGSESDSHVFPHNTLHAVQRVGRCIRLECCPAGMQEHAACCKRPEAFQFARVKVFTLSCAAAGRSSDFEDEDEDEEEEDAEEDAGDSMDDALPDEKPHARQDADADSAFGLDSLSQPMPRQPSGHHQQADVQRQRNLEEALVLQMDMQKRLHDQLEVCCASPQFCHVSGCSQADAAVAICNSASPGRLSARSYHTVKHSGSCKADCLFVNMLHFHVLLLLLTLGACSSWYAALQTEAGNS